MTDNTELLEREMGTTCRWSEDEDGNWSTECDRFYIINEGTPELNGMKFCCFCGAHLEQMLYQEESQPMKNDKAQWIKENLKPGEQYAGLILGKNGAADHHLVLLPGEADAVNWADAKACAKKAGGELPTRREQSLLFANLKAQFPERAYWSGEQHAVDSDYAWFQSFHDGWQDYYDIYSKLRARAVRRVANRLNLR